MHEKILASVCFGDLMRALIGYVPELALSPEEHQACVELGFIITFLALPSIAHLMILSIERTLSIVFADVHATFFNMR